MQNLSMYCISMKSDHLNIIKDFNYIPVGLGSENFSNEWKKDKSGNNIAHKNKYYGEYTFHYWLWKNKLDMVKIAQELHNFGLAGKVIIPVDLRKDNFETFVFEKLNSFESSVKAELVDGQIKILAHETSMSIPILNALDIYNN